MPGITAYQADLLLARALVELENGITDGPGMAHARHMALLVNHEGLPLARTTSGNLELTEDQVGLHVRASLDPADPDVQMVSTKMKRGDLTELSFAFIVSRQTWSDDYSQRTIEAVNLARG